MYKISKPSSNRLDIELHGSLDADSMKSLMDDLFAKSEGMKDGQMLYTITEFKMPTLGAFSVEFSHLPKLFKLLGCFAHCAVLSDEGWIKTAAEIEGALIPGLKIKSFDLNDVSSAEAWLNNPT